MKPGLNLFLKIQAAFQVAVSDHINFMINPPDPLRSNISLQTEISIDDIHRPATSAKRDHVYLFVSDPNPPIENPDDQKRFCFILGEVRDSFKRAGFDILTPPARGSTRIKLFFTAPFTPRTLEKVRAVKDRLLVKHYALTVMAFADGEEAGLASLSLPNRNKRAVEKEVMLMKNRISASSNTDFGL
ncbi:MAG TPA: hypothetical protein DCY07_08605 [Rhodospirillaceae bacterium]|nr:hypothetical protein [Rhodospirillaceae bacterium]